MPSEISYRPLSGFRIIQELGILFLAQYCQMIERPMSDLVARVASGDWALNEAVYSLGEEPLVHVKRAG